MKQPRVSVIMPVYNAENYVAEAMKSILTQTFGDFELIIINDGSTDDSPAVIRSIEDSRIRFIDNRENMGLAHVRNLGLSLATGEFIAWLDSDDISLPDRLERQVRHFDARPDLDICGTWVKTTGASQVSWKYHVEPGILKARMLFDDPLATSSIMMRRRVLEDQQILFDEGCPPAEDYDLWERVSRSANLANLPFFLTVYRLHEMQSSRMGSDSQMRAVQRIQLRQLEQLGILPNSEEEQLHLRVGVKWETRFSSEEVARIEDWFVRLLRANRQRKIYPAWQFRHVVLERYRGILRESPARSARSGNPGESFSRLSHSWRLVYWLRRVYLEFYRVWMYR